MTKRKEFDISISKGSKESIFLFRRQNQIKKEDYDFSGIAILRQILTNEKARILDVIKKENPKSIYDLAKKLGRDFKAVNKDVKLLDKFDLIDLIAEKSGKRERLRPVINIDSVVFKINI